MKKLNDNQNFKNDIEFLNQIISLVFLTDIKYKLEILHTKYKEELLKHTSGGVGEIEELLKKAIKKVLLSLSKEYILLITTKYFTEEGLTYYIVSMLRQSITTTLNEKYYF